MKHFITIQSFEDLKAQYRTLALSNHPDKGGDTHVMQEINFEYEVLFPIWKDKVKDTSTETAHSTRSEFYTQNGWKGENYDSNLRLKDIAKLIREYVKQKYPTYKFSVITPHYSSLYISCMEAPQDVFTQDQLDLYEKRDSYIQINQYNIDNDKRITELCKEILKDVKFFANTYNYDDSDSMVDYFDTNFYLSLSVGKWDKPFRVVHKQARVKGQRTTPAKK